MIAYKFGSTGSDSLECKSAFDAIYKVFGFSPGGEVKFEKDETIYPIDFNIVRLYDKNMNVEEARRRIADAQRHFDFLLKDSNSKIKDVSKHVNPSRFVLINAV